MRPRHVAWLCHPLSGDVPGNIARAKRWLGWLLRTFPQIDFAADWILWCEVLDDSNEVERQRGLNFCEVMIHRCDAIWLVGGAISSGMQREMDAALAALIPIVDLTNLTDAAEPPTHLNPDAVQAMVDKLTSLGLFHVRGRLADNDDDDGNVDSSVDEDGNADTSN